MVQPWYIFTWCSPHQVGSRPNAVFILRNKVYLSTYLQRQQQYGDVGLSEKNHVKGAYGLRTKIHTEDSRWWNFKKRRPRLSGMIHEETHLCISRSCQRTFEIHAWIVNKTPMQQLLESWSREFHLSMIVLKRSRTIYWDAIGNDAWLISNCGLWYDY